MARFDAHTLPIVIVAGPTASGKSALALALAERFRGTVINADSMQVYRDLRVLTARPTPEDEARVPHRLYGVLDGSEHGTAARWRGLALQAVAEAAEAGCVPILCGGTGLYFRALLDGLVDLPPIAAAVKMAARARLAALGAPGLHADLARRDPESAARLQPADSQRIVRAWEVIEGTGRSLTEWQRQSSAPPLPNPVCRLLLRPPRAALYRRIDGRFEKMLTAGALEEARAVAARHLPVGLPMLKAHGLPELLAYLAGTMDLAHATAQAQANTRHYAKRQTTWFRHQFAADLVEENDLNTQENFNLEVKIFPFIVRYLLTWGYPHV